jgi:membrane-bound ClpP family serine protease
MPLDVLGIAILLVGIALLALEVIHPGALLLIPGSIFLVAGFLYLFFPSALLDSWAGPLAIVVAGLLATGIEIPYYRWVAPVRPPMSTTSAGFTGEEATVLVAIEPNTLRGKVRVRSQVWSATSVTPIPVGTRVKVVHGEGVSLRVVPVDPSSAADPLGKA